MKNKIILILVCLLSLPTFASAYNPTDMELRSSIFDYIGSQSQRQQQQDIIDEGNRGYKNAFDTYYQNTNALENEYKLRLKELELKEDAQKRDEAWQKEKAVLDKELELIRKENELKKREDAISNPVKSGIDLDKILKEVDEEMKTRKLESNNTSNGSESTPLYDQYLKEKQTQKSTSSIVDSVQESKPSKIKHDSLDDILFGGESNTTNYTAPKSQTRFERFKQASADTIKEVASWLNPVSWFKKKVTTPEVAPQKDYSYEAFLKDQANK